MSSNTIYLITGANRGLGRGLTAAYLSRPNNTIIAAVRDPSHATSQSLSSLTVGEGSNLIIVSIDSSSPTSAASAIDTLRTTHSITHLDTVIANAAIGYDYSPIATVTLPVLKEHVETNAYGPILLFQATLSLLEKSTKAKFVALGTPMGSIGGMEMRPYPSGAYGPSKAMMHWAVRKMSQEHGEICAFVVDPGFVQTDMGNQGARNFGMEKAHTSVEDSIKFLVTTIDEATQEKTSGRFPSFEGGDFAW